MTSENKLFWAFLLGFASVYLLKYVIFGLDLWNGVLHPNRREGPKAQRYFGKPLLGLFSSGAG